jgi:hypothetical protein
MENARGLRRMIIVQNLRRGTVAWLHTGCEMTIHEYQREDDYSPRGDALMWQMTGLVASCPTPTSIGSSQPALEILQHSSGTLSRCSS